MTKYKHTQYGVLLNLSLLALFLFVLYTYYFQTASKPILFLPTIFVMAILGFVILSFYKLTLIIDDKKFTAIFGIGLIKKSVLLKDIDLNSIEKVSMPWYVGIGIRLTRKGWLWNVKVGDAIYLKAKNKTFLVGTADFDNIKNILTSSNFI